MKTIACIGVIVAIIFTTSSPIFAQWVQTNGPYGGYIRCFAVSGTNIFAGTGGGVFLSANNGTSWTDVNKGLTNTDVQALAVSGTNLFAGTWGGGVFLSTNNGISWTAVNTGLTNTDVQALAVSGTNIFAGTDGGGVFLSTNNGTSWTAVNMGLPHIRVYSLAVSGTNIFAGTRGDGVFLSTNNGTSWTAVNKGLTNDYVHSLAVSGTNIFAGTEGCGVFLSTNNGISWTAVNTDFMKSKEQLEIHTSFGLRVVDGKQWRSNFFNNIFPPYKSHITWNRFLSPKIGIGLRIDGMGNIGVGFSFSNSKSDSISRTNITERNDREIPYFLFGPNVGVLYYFAPQQYSYLRLGLLLNYFDGPYKISDGYYFQYIGWFLAPNVELRFASWDNSLSFESSFSYSQTDFQFCKLDNSNDNIKLQIETGDFYWLDFTLRYRPNRASEYSHYSHCGDYVSGIGFYVSFRPIYGKLQVLDKPRFFIGMLNLGIEWSINSISDLARSQSSR